MSEDELINKLLKEHIEGLFMDANDAMKACESPIERMLALALFFKWGVTKQAQYHPEGGHKASDLLDMMQYPRQNLQFIVAPQVHVGPYRVDFMICGKGYDNDSDCLMLVVECDGHDFHEKTKDQAARDKSRDRYFASLGYAVMRFTGTEIHRNIDKCVDEIIHTIGAHEMRMMDMRMAMQHASAQIPF